MVGREPAARPGNRNGLSDVPRGGERPRTACGARRDRRGVPLLARPRFRGRGGGRRVLCGPAGPGRGAPPHGRADLRVGGRHPRRARGDSRPESLESGGGHASNMMYVAPPAVLVGDVTVEEGASVWHGAVLRGDFDSIVVGEDSNVQDNVVVHVDRGMPALIGARVTVGHAAVLHGCTIEDDCLIGMSATINSGARIGTGSPPAPGSPSPGRSPASSRSRPFPRGLSCEGITRSRSPSTCPRSSPDSSVVPEDTQTFFREAPHRPAMTRFTTEIQMRFRDIDGMGHVNNAVYLSYTELARTQFYLKIAKKDRLEDIDFILAHVDIDFESQAEWGDEIRVSVWPSKIGRTSFTLSYEITESRSGRVIAKANSVLVSYDYESRKPKPIPEGFRTILASALESK